MAGAAESTSIEREIEIAASPETVWQFLVDPTRAVQWMGLTATFDPRPGGLYQVEVIPGHLARGTFVELDPPRRLVLTFGWESGGENPIPPGSTTVEFDLIPTTTGTTLRFLHRGLPHTQAVWSNARGWDHYLPRLALAARGQDPGTDPWITGGVG